MAKSSICTPLICSPMGMAVGVGDGVMVAVGKGVAVAVGDGNGVAVARSVGDGTGEAVAVAVAGMVAMAAMVGNGGEMACVRGVHALMRSRIRGKTAVNAIFPFRKLTIITNREFKGFISFFYINIGIYSCVSISYYTNYTSIFSSI